MNLPPANRCQCRWRTPMVALFALVMLSGCYGSSGNTDETSEARWQLADRIQFVEQYVSFRRQYKQLDYDIYFQNQGRGSVPGPSEWDVRLIAEVPAEDLDDWIPQSLEEKEQPIPNWVRDLPGTIERSGLQQWYVRPGMEVGIDRKRSIVAYRNTTMPD